MVFAFISILINVACAFIMYRLNVPFYLDTIGTVAVSSVMGAFPGIMVAVATNIICGLFNQFSIYYTSIGVLIAVATALIVGRTRLKTAVKIGVLTVVLAALGGGLAMSFQWILQGGPQFKEVADMTQVLTGKTAGTRYFFGAVLVNTLLHVVDKGLSVLIAFLALYFIPTGKKEMLRNGRWKQRPLSDEEIRNMTDPKIDGARHKIGIPLRLRMIVMLVIAALLLTVALVFISVTLHFESTKSDYTNNAKKAAFIAASIIDPAKIDDYIQDGEEVKGYKETENMLYKIREASSGVKYLYVIKIENDGCYVAFDLETEDTPAHRHGDKIEFEKAFEPYLPALFAGEEIEPIESDDLSGWVLTAYQPIRDIDGVTKGYACTDVSMTYLSDYVKTYLLRMILVFSGFVIPILAYGFWVSDYSLVYPIGTMSSAVEGFFTDSDEQETLDDNVRMIRKLDIRTDDEIQRLYDSICRMASSVNEQMRSVRHYAEATAQMQNGLILTMADMVESRDSDTGAHVQKTSAYVRIILEGLRAKGYYASKLTTKYMNDVEMSAPLHDVGKINIPDAVLNKPGKLDDEEFAIMKTHTTAGKEILEKAINTVKGGSYLKEARNMAAYHHERWDGKGYPEGLHGEVIPLSARVMAVADVFDALASPRVYKPAFPLDKALSIIEEGAGTQFDPKVVEVFLEHLDEVKQVLKKFQE